MASGHGFVPAHRLRSGQRVAEGHHAVLVQAAGCRDALQLGAGSLHGVGAGVPRAWTPEQDALRSSRGRTLTDAQTFGLEEARELGVKVWERAQGLAESRWGDEGLGLRGELHGCGRRQGARLRRARVLTQGRVLTGFEIPHRVETLKQINVTDGKTKILTNNSAPTSWRL